MICRYIIHDTHSSDDAHSRGRGAAGGWGAGVAVGVPVHLYEIRCRDIIIDIIIII
jgi:hypothetical protein